MVIIGIIHRPKIPREASPGRGEDAAGRSEARERDVRL